MKSFRKISLAMLITVFAISVLLLVSMTSFFNHVADADDTISSARIEIKVKDKDGNLTDPELDEDGKTVVLAAGQTFTTVVTYSTTREGLYWFSADTRVALITTDSEGKDVSYDAVGEKLTRGNATLKFVDEDGNEYDYSETYMLVMTSYTDAKGFRFAISRIGEELAASELSLTIAEEFTIDSKLEATTFELGMFNLTTNEIRLVSIDEDGTILSTEIDNTKTAMSVNRVKVKIREVSDDATLKELEVGHSGYTTLFSSAEDADNKISATKGDMTYTSDNEDLASFTVKPTATDSHVQKIEVSLTELTVLTDSDISTADDDGDGSDGTDESTESSIKEVDSGESTTLTLQPGENILYIRVTAENGSQQVYTVTISMAYVRLEVITSNATTEIEGVTKNGLVLGESGLFEKDEYTYTVYVPSKFSDVQISATVLDGYKASDAIAFVAGGCTVAEDSFSSKGILTITSFDEDAESYSLKLTATASDGKNTKEYTLNFEFVSVETDINVTVTGANGNIDNDEDTAASEKADYYFSLKDEPDNGKVKVNIVPASDEYKLAIEVDSVEYLGETEYGAGIYSVEVTAEAGNTKTYILMLSKSVFLKLSETAKTAGCDFVTEYEFDDDGELLYYRRTYEYLGWTHGYDDTALDTIVLGQLLTWTSLNTLLSYVDEEQVKQIILYDNDGEVVYYGSPAEDSEYYNEGKPYYNLELYDDEEENFDDGEYYPVATGWRIVFNDETVYLSVLGDTNGDGDLSGADSSAINIYLMESSDDVVARFEDNVYVRLAAYITNGGSISTADSSIINSSIMEKAKIENYLAMPEKEDEE